MIASLHDENNHITIPGFYDKVEELSKEERAEMAKAPFSLENYKKALRYRMRFMAKQDISQTNAIQFVQL